MPNSFISSHELLLEDQGRQRVAQQLHAVLVDWYGNTSLKQLTVLDYGCSSGIITNFIARYCNVVLGIDVDEIAIKKAEEKHKLKNLSFLLTKNEKLPLKNNSFDLVICNQVYSYLDNPKLMMDEIYRVTKVGGVCLFTGDNLLRPIEPLYNLPLIRLLPKNIAISLLKLLGHKNIYVGEYKTYWGLKKLACKFTVNDYTIRILKNPKRFNYLKLEKYSPILSIIPNFILKFLEPFSPSFVFLLEKK